MCNMSICMIDNILLVFETLVLNMHPYLHPLLKPLQFPFSRDRL